MRLPRADFPALTVALWVMMVLLVAYLVGLLIPRSGPSFLVDVVLCIGAEVAAIAVFLVVAVHTRFARAEIVIAGVAVVCTVAGDVIYIALADTDGYLPSPSIADAAYLLFYPLLFAAFVAILRRYPLPEIRVGWAVALDAAVAAMGSGALLALVLGPVLANVGYPISADVLIAASYPAIDLLLVAIVGAVAASPAINLGRRALYFVFGLLAFAAADVVYTLLGVAQLYQTGHPIDALWAVGIALFAWWAAGQTIASEPRLRSSATAIPILSASVLTALGVLVYASQFSVNLVAVVLAACALGLAAAPVILRQIESKRILVAQQEVVAQLEELDRAKTEMLATVNHEIRTPLTSIRGYLELVIHGEAGDISEEAKETLRVVDHNADRLALLVDDMLTMSRLDSDTAVPEREPVDVRRLLYRVVASLQPFASSREVSLDIDEDDVEAIVIGDEVQLERAFTNITQNGLKFTPTGGFVGIELEREGTNIVVRVIDTGMGIPDSDKHLLFNRFYRASNAQRDGVPGTGLGLAIVSSLVRANQGEISIASTLNVGTTVRVTLPMAE